MSINRVGGIKIIIIDQGKRIFLPKIGFWLIRFVGKIGLSIAANHLSKEKDSKELKKLIKEIDINMIINEFREYGPFVLVDVEDHNSNTKVFIEVR